MSDEPTYTGECFCGAVAIEATGAPEAMGYCHCESCRHWSAGPVNTFTLWKPESVRVVRGEDRLGSYSKTPKSHRKWCQECGGHVLGEHPHWGLVDVFAPLLPGLDFQPEVHVNYQEGMLPIHDGLPKLKDFPAEMGGSGEQMAE